MVALLVPACAYRPVVIGKNVVGIGCFRLAESSPAPNASLSEISGVGALYFHGIAMMGYADIVRIECPPDQDLSARVGPSMLYSGRIANQVALLTPDVAVKTAEAPGVAP